MYQTREKLPGMVASLKACIEDDRLEDAQQWALEILNSLFGLVMTDLVKVRDAVADALVGNCKK